MQEGREVEAKSVIRSKMTPYNYYNQLFSLSARGHAVITLEKKSN